MKFLGIDYGKKRVGIAVSDIDGKVAFPREIMENNKDLVSKILDLCNLEKIETIVVGESKDYKGEDNKINPEIIAFKKILAEKSGLKVFFEPEFMSSMQVEKTFGKTEMLDASAASIILQTFLDKEKTRQEKREKEAKSVVPEKISYDDFKKVEMTVGKILAVEKIDGSDKLLKLSVDFKEAFPRQILSGIAKYFPEEQVLVGKKVVFVTNLAPRQMMGLESNGMILAASDDNNISLMEVSDIIQEGTKLK